MSQFECEAFALTSIPNYAESVARDRDLALADALVIAEKAFHSLLPDLRVDTPDQYVCKIQSEHDGRVGSLWFGIRRDRRTPYAYVWDITLEDRFRGKGYGEQAMRALETKARELGAVSIGLNVFGFNTPAVRLYQKLGYTAQSMAMQKTLCAPGS